MTGLAADRPDTRQYETILETIRDGVYTLDAEGRITWVNNTVLEEFDIGYDRNELIGAPVSKLLSADDIETCAEIILDSLQNEDRNGGKCEIDIQAADGRRIPCELHLTLLPFDDGDFQGTVGVVREIAERKRREQMLEVMNRVLRHNLRNDMNVIIGRAELLEDRLSGEYREQAHCIQEVGTELITLAEKIRWLAELDELTAPRPIPVDIEARLQDCIERIEADYEDVSLSLKSTTEADHRLRIGRRELFDFVITEILENVARHIDDPMARIEVSVPETGDECCITVADNGPGLPDIERTVLERGTESPLEHGSGIGLWLVYWSLNTIGGAITFDDTRDGGTAISLHFPRQSAG